MLATIFSSQSDTLTNNRYSPKEKYSQMDICCNTTNYFMQMFFSSSQMFMLLTWLLNSGFQIKNLCCIRSDQDRISLNNINKIHSRLLVDLIPNSPSYHDKNCIAEGKENQVWDLESERVNKITHSYDIITLLLHTLCDKNQYHSW